MLNEKRELTMAHRWDGHGMDSINDFKKTAGDLVFGPAVHEDVVKRFEVVKTLVVYSFSEWDFLDVAQERALSTFELALRMRYLEIEGHDPGEKELGDLINWGNSKGLFEKPKKQIDKIRELRNKLVGHPESYQLYGSVAFHLIFEVCDLINGLYEDLTIRKARKQELRKANSVLKGIISNGGLLDLTTARIIVFHASLIHFDRNNGNYFFLFYPIFDMEMNNEKLIIPEPLVIQAKGWVLDHSIFYIDCRNNIRFSVTGDLSEENMTRFRDWKKRLERTAHPVETYINERINEAAYIARKSQ